MKVDAPRLIKMPSSKAARREDPEAYAGRVRWGVRATENAAGGHFQQPV